MSKEIVLTKPNEAPAPVIAPEPEVAPAPEEAPAPEASPEPEVVPEPEAAPEPEVAPEAEVAPEPEIAPEPEAAPEPETVPAPSEPKTSSEPAPLPGSAPMLSPDSADTSSEPAPEPAPAPEPTPTPETANAPEDSKPPEPTRASSEAANISFELQILSEQFENYLRVAQAFLKTLKRPKDIEIGSNLLRKVQRLNDSKKLDVKRHNNAFFRYWLRVLKWTSDNQPVELYNYWFQKKDVPEAISESRTWLEDNKSYMALKYLTDGTYIIYAAVAEDPSAGWLDGGLDILAKRGAS